MLPVDEIRLNFNPASLVVLNVVLGFLMFGIALDTRVADFKRVLRMPGAMAVGIAAQFIVLPAVTFVLTLLLQPGPSIALGMILVACCPPGNVSNILTHRAGGNVALSVSMTAISNALAIVLMPLNFAFWGGLHPTAAPLLRSIALDPLEMAGHIVAIIGLPFALGILCAEKLPRFTQRVNKPVRILSFVCLIGFIVGAVAGNCSCRDTTRSGQASTTSTAITAQSCASATLTKSLTMRSANPWKPSASAGPSRREVGSNSRVRLTLQASSASAWNSQRPCRRLNGPSRSCISMLLGRCRVFSVMNQVENAPNPRSRRATRRSGPDSRICAAEHQRKRRG